MQIIIPARDEAETIGATIRSLALQDYPWRFRILVVNDRRRDHTGAMAQAAGAEVLEGQGKAPGWSGKLYALQQGLDAVAGRGHGFLLFTDADITHAPDSLRRLVQRAEAGQLDLVSLMVRPGPALEGRGPVARMKSWQHMPLHPFGADLKWPIERVEGFTSGAGARGIAT